jgi:mono/diheme cytochrome c family protein
MSGTILGLFVFVLLTAIFGWVARKAWGVQRGWIKWLGVVLAGLFTFIFSLLTVLGAVGTYELFRSNDIAIPQVIVAGTPDQIARGEYLSNVLCATCHSLDGELPMTGGKNMSEDAGMPLGDLYAPNITPAGDIAQMSDAELFLLIRTGVNEEGRATSMAAVMGPRSLSDEDILAVIAFLRQSPAVEEEKPPFKPTVLLAVFVGAGLIPLDVPSSVEVVSAPSKAATVEYGEYVTAYMDCRGCHGSNLDGVVPPPYPPAPNIRPLLSTWTKGQFLNNIQGHVAAPKPGDIMVWKYLLRMEPVEFEAMYLYLHQVTSK